MKKIKAQTTLNVAADGVSLPLVEGEVYEVSDAVAKWLIRVGFAEPVPAPKKAAPKKPEGKGVRK